MITTSHRAPFLYRNISINEITDTAFNFANYKKTHGTEKKNEQKKNNPQNVIIYLSRSHRTSSNVSFQSAISCTFSNYTRHSILEYKSKIQQVVLFSIENLHCHKVHSPSKRILCVVRLFLLVFQCIVQMVNVNHGWIKFITIKPLLLRQFGFVAIVVVVVISRWRSSNTSLSFDWNQVD